MLFSDISNGSVQKVDIIWVVVNLMEQNRPLVEPESILAT